MLWNDVQPAPPDAILGLTEAFRNDPEPRKVNLGVGVYKDEAGNTPVLESVKEAERRLLETETSKSYLPIPGDPLYGEHVRELLFGPRSEIAASGRAVTAHTPGGTGALRLGATLLHTFHPGAAVWLSRPTWANHRGIFAAAGFELREYPYYDPETRGVDFDALHAALSEIPAGDIVVLHVCCHNPTGADLDDRQWRQIAALAAEKGWVPFLDFAYQGFAESLEADRRPLEHFAAAGIDFLVAGSFSKNFGLYCERTGALTLIAPDRRQAETAFSHLKRAVRVTWSNPPAHGGRIVTTILGDDALRRRWEEELAAMRDRIRNMRILLAEKLAARRPDRDFSFITRQRGMFSFSGLSDAVVDWLRANRSIYIVKGGRINVAGLTPRNIDYVCDAVADALDAVE